MKRTYSVVGMTCEGCVASVRQKLLEVNGIQEVQVDLATAQAVITMEDHVLIAHLKAALSEKYTIEEQVTQKRNSFAEGSDMVSKTPKWKQLRPLFLIFGYLFATAILLNYRAWDIQQAMLDFMGLFYVVFSFFKFLDLKGFPRSFAMYDPLAKAIPAYGWLYPFLELALGLMFLMRFQIGIALVATIVILGITTVGVTKTLLDKKTIRCACLGTALHLPMTEATFIENTMMLVMAFSMLLM